MTAFAGLTTALVQALVQAPALAGGRVFPNRLRPIPDDRATAVVVRIGQRSQAQEIVLGAYDWTTPFSVECIARGTSGLDPQAAVDALLADVWARLYALDITALGAMSVTVNPAIEWSVDEADSSYICASIQLDVAHRTPLATLAALT